MLNASNALSNFIRSVENATAAHAAGVLTSLLVALRIHASDARASARISSLPSTTFSSSPHYVWAGPLLPSSHFLLPSTCMLRADALVTKVACGALVGELFNGVPNFGPDVIAAPVDMEAVVAASAVASAAAIATGMAPGLLFAALRSPLFA